VVVFGEDFSSDTWEFLLDRGVWRQICASCSSPLRGESYHIFDPFEKRMIMFGGQDGGAVITNDLWQLLLK